MYKVGDIVLIKYLKGDISFNREYSVIFFNMSMTQYCGKRATIKRKTDSSYIIDLDNGKWSWCDEMFDNTKAIRKKKLERIENV